MMETDSSSFGVRRFLAIVAVVLTIVFLFWPSIIRPGFGEDGLRMFYGAEQMSKDEFGDYFAREFAGELSEKDVEKAREVGLVLYDLLTDESYTLSFARLCTFFPRLLKYAAPVDYSYPIVIGVILNGYFFAILIVAFAAIPMILFNKTKACNIVLVVLTVQMGALFLLLGLLGLFSNFVVSGAGSVSVSFGAATFLLPASAVASLILYKRVKPEPETPPPAGL